VLVVTAELADIAAVVVGVAVAVVGMRRPLMSTVRRLLQWPQRTVTVLNRLLLGTLTCKRPVPPVKSILKFPRKKRKREGERGLITDDEDGVADVAVHVAELLGVGGCLFLHRCR
jgi:hypothetical protein